MRLYFTLTIFSISVLLLAAVIHERPSTQSNDTKNSFAVVELFTSEGCSSCPPADRLLGEIVKKARNNNQPIYALAFHVDYWDYIGWKDPYASSAYSQRQQNYAQAFRSSRIYTPQMIVNGRREFVGSNKSKAEDAIAKALEKEAAQNIEIAKMTEIGNMLKVQYALSKQIPNKVLNIALVERDLEQQVKRGENRGRTLHHDNVVRAFRSITMDETASLSGTISLQIPDAIDREKAAVILYVQDGDTMEILGATGSDI